MTNKEFSKTNLVFNRACTLANTKSTARQASKYLRKKGLAFEYNREAFRQVRELK